MLKNPEDRRARRTRRLLRESLLELLEEKRFGEISIRDVTDRADVNRTTFYLHYTDTAQLLRSVEEELLGEAQALIDAHIRETVQDGTMGPVFEPVLDFVVEHRKVCAVLMENQEASRFTEHLQTLIRANGGEIIRAWFPEHQETAVSYVLQFAACGLIGLVTEWFQRNMDLSKEELLTAAEGLVRGAASGLLIQ